MKHSHEQTVEVQDRRELPFFQVHLAAVRAIRETESGPSLVRAIGFYALQCQLANEQRHTGEHRAGLTADRLDRCKEILERTGVVSIERRRAGNGGRHLPNTYTLHEAPPSATQGGEPGLAGGQTGSGRAASRDWQGPDLGMPGRQIRNRRAALPPPSVLVCRPLTRARESVP